jgi:hypothetical protein
LHHAKITDEALKSLAGMPQLERLWLSGTKVSDRGIAHLRGHPSLVDIDLGYTAITDSALAELATIPRLSDLDLTATAVTDQGLAHLERHAQLSYINLQLTEIRGSGLASLSRLPSLQELCLGGRRRLENVSALAECRGLKRLNLFGVVAYLEELERTDLPRVIELPWPISSDDVLKRHRDNTAREGSIANDCIHFALAGTTRICARYAGETPAARRFAGPFGGEIESPISESLRSTRSSRGSVCRTV